MEPTAEPAAAAPVHIAKLPGGKPDTKAHNEEMDRLRAEIEQVQKKVNAVRASLSGEGADTPAGQRRAALRAELDALRSQQSGRKGTRGKVFDELKALQDDIAAKVKALHAAKSKAPYKSQAEVDAQIAQIEQQIESGSMKIVEERKALNEISHLKRARKSMEQLTTQQAQIDAQRAEADKVRATLDDPESQALSRRYDAIKQELDGMNKEQEKTVGSRSKLLAKRTALSKQLDDLYQARRDRLQAYHAENDKYYARMTAERERRNDTFKKEKEEADLARQQHELQELREDAALPAFAKEIEDCDVLVRYFSTSAEAVDATDAKPAPAPAGTAPRESEGVPEGAVVAKKKGQDDEDYFVGVAKKNKNKGKKNKGSKAVPEGAEATGSLHVPFGMLSALLSLSIPPPMNQSDLPRVVENVKLKRAYFVSNQERVTQENIAKAEKTIAQRQEKSGSVDTT